MHEASVYKCPLTSCERHNRTFPREYNMLDHIQRVHKDVEIAPLVRQSKRAKKNHGTISHNSPSSKKSSNGSGNSSSRKSGTTGARIRPQKLEKQFRICQEQIRKVSARICAMPGISSDITDLEQLRTELDSMINLSKAASQYQNSVFAND
jgi:hypothetical protein